MSPGSVSVRSSPMKLLSSSTSPMAAMRKSSLETRVPSPKPVVPSSPPRVVMTESLVAMMRVNRKSRYARNVLSGDYRMFSSSSIRSAVAAALAVTACYSVPAHAQEGSGSGEVRRIDAQAGKVTIKHGPIDALELPAMTLVYQVDQALLTNLQPGDKIKFKARRVNGQYVVVEISK